MTSTQLMLTPSITLPKKEIKNKKDTSTSYFALYVLPELKLFSIKFT